VAAEHIDGHYRYDAEHDREADDRLAIGGGGAFYYLQEHEVAEVDGDAEEHGCGNAEEVPELGLDNGVDDEEAGHGKLGAEPDFKG